MIRRALAASVVLQSAPADSVYDVGERENGLRWAGKGYLIGMNSAHRFMSSAKTPRIGGAAFAVVAFNRPM